MNDVILTASATDHSHSTEMKTTINQLYPDIWQQIFEYFNAIEILFSFKHITREADDVLFNRNYRLFLRGLVLDAHVETLPEKLLLNQVISLELHEKSYFNNIQQCLELRSLKLIGHPQWIIGIIEKMSHVHMKLERLILVVPGAGSLYDLLASIASLFSLRRLAIYANEIEERIKPASLPQIQTQIEQFILDSCSSISRSELLYILSILPNIHFLDITLFYYNTDTFYWFGSQKLRSISLILLEVQFDCIIQLVQTMPSLAKLRLKGLVNAEGFVINNKWLNLFESCSSLLKVIVSLSLEQDINYCYNEQIERVLREINLNLRCVDDDCGHYFGIRHPCRWWSLSGMIVKEDGHIK